MGSASLTWFVVTSIFQSGTTTTVTSTSTNTSTKEESKGDFEDDSKEDTETEGSNSSGGVIKVKDEETESNLLQSYPVETGDAGIGSGLENAEARGIQKRRKHSQEL